MITQCLNPKCKYKWDYKGESPFYATCPRCLQKVRIIKGELNAGPITKSPADASNKASENNILNPAIDSSSNEKKAEINAGNGSNNHSNNDKMSDFKDPKKDEKGDEK